MRLYRGIRPDQPKYSLAGRFYARTASVAQDFGDPVVAKDVKLKNPARTFNPFDLCRKWGLGDAPKQFRDERFRLCKRETIKSVSACRNPIVHSAYLLIDTVLAIEGRKRGHDAIVYQWSGGIVQLLNER